MYAGHDGNVYKNTGSGWQSYNNGSWNNVNTQQAQQKAQQQSQNYQQQHPDSQANAQQHAQSMSQDRSSGGWDSQNLDSDKQNRMNGSSSSSGFNRSGSSGGWAAEGGTVGADLAVAAAAGAVVEAGSDDS